MATATGRTTNNLVIRAGTRAAARLRAEGFHADLFGTLVGASGGAKWIVLRHLDTVLIDRLILPRSTPIDAIGSSLGSFRHACFAQAKPHAALDRFDVAYVEQAYEGTVQPPQHVISEASNRILERVLGEKGAEEICSNGLVRSHVVAARLRKDRGLDRGRHFKLQLGTSATLNVLSRRLLARRFDRILFHTEEPGTSSKIPAESAKPVIRFDDFETHFHALTPDRVRSALLASGSIPLLMEGVDTVPGVPGMLFDGGIIDYHFDFGFRRREGLVLFAHFFDRIVPGWFDKPLAWRRPRAEALEDVLMVAPSDAFIASLPGGKVPDRNDFLAFSTKERIARWRGITEQCRVLADELDELIATNRVAEAVVPFRS
jgi:hypothetical protein